MAKSGEIIIGQQMISFIDNPKDGRMGVYAYENKKVENTGGFVVLKPKLEPESIYDKKVFYQGRSYWDGDMGSGKVIPLAV